MTNCKNIDKLIRINSIRAILKTNDFLSVEELMKKTKIARSSIHYLISNQLSDMVEFKIIKGTKYVKLTKNKNTKFEDKSYLYNKAIIFAKKLRNEGYSYSEIQNFVNKEFGLSLGDGTLNKHLSKIEINEKGKNRLLEKIKKDRSLAGFMGIQSQIANGRDLSKLFDNCRYDSTLEIKEQEPQLNVIKARLIGHCMFDGYVRDDYEAFTISYSSIVEEQVENFRTLLREVYGLDSSKEKREDGLFTARSGSKNAVIDLLSYTPSYSTKEITEAMVPNDIMNGPKEIKIAFLKAFWNDEGCIVCDRVIDKRGYTHFSRQLEGSTENDNVRIGLLKLHKDIGLDAKNWGKKIIINGLENLKLFKENIGFEPYAIVSKNYDSLWYGVQKHRILEHSIKTFEKIPKAFIETYGCAANKTDSSSIKGVLFKIGFDITQNIDEADLVFVNTCGVKGKTESKIINSIENISETKKVLVGGCLTKIINVNKSLNENIKVFDTNTVSYLAQLIFGNKNELLSTKKESRLHLINPLLEKNETFIMPISQGCMDNCYYCATKIARGNLKSYTKEELIQKAEEALNNGHKIIHLTSQDNGCYGLDIGDNLVNLINSLSKIEREFYIKVGMMHPRHVTPILKELIEAYKNLKVIKFLHIPIQSGSDKILLEMNRKGTIKEFKDIINSFRKQIPGITIATDIIVGYPSENDEDFKETVELVKEIKFEVMNISKFASRPRTKASKLKQLHSQIIDERGRS